MCEKMSQSTNDLFSPITDSVKKLGKYLSDRTLITDLIAKLVITFGVVLIIAGLYLMMDGPGGSSSATQSMILTVNWIPGIPFYIGNLANVSASAAGLASWFVGLDLLLVGLGLWVRHKFARFTALMFFALAAFFQFVQFLYFGVLGAGISLVQFCIDGLLIYFLLSRFDSQINVKASRQFEVT